jgi:hypothetical protein
MMRDGSTTVWGAVWRALVVMGVASHGYAAMAQAPDSESATALRAQVALMDEPLHKNAFQRPLVLLSTETPQGLRGDIYARMAYPFEAMSAALRVPKQWCEVMILHINTKYCHAATDAAGTVLSVSIGTKGPQELAQASRVTFNFQLRETTPEYFEVLLDAKDGPLGTRDYRIRLEAVALAQDQTFLHLTYSYSANFAGKLAMQAYLATTGADKVGFTVIDTVASGQPVFVDGVRGLVERNTMRYYLAIDSYMASRQSPPLNQLEERLQSWFSAVEQYPRQLHEMDRPAYLVMKRAEYLRQQTER